MKMRSPYRKHYPPTAARAQAARFVLAVLRRAPGRPARWFCQAQRRRPWLLRPLTSGEQRLLAYRAKVEELAALLLPFRQSRLRGHGGLYDLLCDRDSRPAVLGQVLALEACATRLTPDYNLMERQMEHWRREWARATPAQQQRLTEEEKALAVSNYHTALNLLLQEARADVAAIRGLCPPAFEPAIVATATTPTPYSA